MRAGFALHAVIRTALLPVLALQGLACYRRTRCLPFPDGPRGGQAGTGPALRLMILGDSSAAGVGVAHQDQALSGHLVRSLAPDYALDWRLEAEIGADTGRVLGWLEAMPPARYDVVLTALGVNDITHRVSRARWLAQTAAMIETLSTKFGTRLIILSAVPPIADFPLLPNPLRWVLAVQGRRFNRALFRLAAGYPNVRVIGGDIRLCRAVMSPDGYHPGAPVYAAWADRAARVIRQPDAAPTAPALDPQPVTA